MKPGPFHDTEILAYTAQDFRFTTKGSELYAIELAWPSAAEAVISSLGTGASTSQPVRSVQLLGSNARLDFEQRADGLHITLPPRPAAQPAYVFRVTLSPSAAAVSAPAATQSFREP